MAREGARLLVLEERQHNLGRLRNVDAHAHQALGLAQQLQDLAIEVDVQLLRGRVAHDERRLSTQE
eukprot:2251091-Pleurochrysis_carterae.AAC.1